MGDQNNQQAGNNPINQTVQIPEKPKINYWMITTIILSLIFLGVLSVLALNLKTQRENANITTIPVSKNETPITKPTVFSSPTASSVKPTPSDPTVDWKIYEGVTAYSGKFSIKYPSGWALKRMEGGVGKGDLLFPLGDINADIINYKAPYILLGTGGHGGGCEEQSRVFTAGEAKYCWGEFGGMARFNKNNADYILEAYYYGNPKSLTNEQYKNIFDQILNTFKFLD